MKDEKFYQNHQKSTKIDLFLNPIQLSFKYFSIHSGYDFHGHTTFFDKIMIFRSKFIFDKILLFLTEIEVFDEKCHLWDNFKYL